MLSFYVFCDNIGPPPTILYYIPLHPRISPLRKTSSRFFGYFSCGYRGISYGKFNGQIPWHSSSKQFSIIELSNIMFIEFSGGHIINDSNLYPNKLVNIYDHLWTSMMSPRFFLWIRCYPILVGLISPVLIVVFSPTIYSTLTSMLFLWIKQDQEPLFSRNGYSQINKHVLRYIYICIIYYIS